MQYRTDLKSGNELSALGFGCMRLPRSRPGQVDLDKTAAMLQSAVERGVNYFDTAYIYGGSETALGDVFRLRPGLREQMNIATKLPIFMVKTAEDFDRLFDTSLERLGTDHIDYYLIHGLTALANWERLCALGAEDWIAKQKAAGRIRRIGFSFHGSRVDFERLLDAYPWEFAQIQYNYSDENYQAGVAGLKKAAAMGLPVIVMEPLLGGRLATGLPKKAAALLDKLDPGRSHAAWALRWLWDQPEVTCVLSGMNGMEQLDDNIATAEAAVPGCLTPEERATYPKLVEILREAYKIPCTGCNYCMPCPKNVNIPGGFAAYNASYAVDMFTGFAQYTTGMNIALGKDSNSARNCVGCGACAKKCPADCIVQVQGSEKKRPPYEIKQEKCLKCGECFAVCKFNAISKV